MYKSVASKVATSGHSAGKRPYLDDLKPFSTVYGVKNIGMQFAYAVIMTSSLAMMEYNTYMERAIELSKLGVDIEDFDWQGTIEKYKPKFVENLAKFLSVSFIKKVLEELSSKYFSAKIADRLCKDAMKSMTRKIAKYSRWTASNRMFLTSMWSSVLMQTSSLIYDIFERLYIMYKDKKERVSMPSFLVWVFKKIGYYTICSSTAAIGFSVGGYMHHTVGSSFGAAFGQVAGSIIATNMLKL